ncbi:hypothetical protein HJFPF1_06299 [Paramyrothecium foliicola]|nr:hypothetical protein HJFPF1_06299 [Paramyrothecium foliicola]
MPLSQRTSGSHERKTSTGSSGKSGASRGNHVRFSDVDSGVGSGLETEEDLRDALQRANTEWNKANEARDKFQLLYEQTNAKLSEANKAKDDLKSETLAVKDHNAALKQELQRLKDLYAALKYEHRILSQSHEELRTKHDALALRYSTPHQPSPTAAKADQLPERPKASRTSTKEKHRDERSRTKDKEKEREKERDKENKAERERLLGRFEGKRPSPPGHRDSFIEPWGPGGRSPTVDTATRAYPNVATGRLQPPALTQALQPAYSNVPRVANPLSPGIYSSTAIAFDDDEDDDDYEDGNYHAHPLAR